MRSVPLWILRYVRPLTLLHPGTSGILRPRTGASSVSDRLSTRTRVVESGLHNMFTMCYRSTRQQPWAFRVSSLRTWTNCVDEWQRCLRSLLRGASQSTYNATATAAASLSLGLCVPVQGYVANQTGMSACLPCPVGRFSIELVVGQPTCAPCNVGYYTAISGSSTCGGCQAVSPNANQLQLHTDSALRDT